MPLSRSPWAVRERSQLIRIHIWYQKSCSKTGIIISPIYDHLSSRDQSFNLRSLIFMITEQTLNTDKDWHVIESIKKLVSGLWVKIILPNNMFPKNRGPFSLKTWVVIQWNYPLTIPKTNQSNFKSFKQPHSWVSKYKTSVDCMKF